MKGRTAFLAINLLAVAISVLIGLNVLPGPDLIGTVLAFYVLFVLPGMSLEKLFVGFLEISIESICRIFGMSLVLVSLLVFIGIIPGISYVTISLIVAAVNICLLLVAARRGDNAAESAEKMPAEGMFPARRKDRPGWGTRLLLAVLLFCVCFIFFYGSGELGWSTDALDHLSFIRRSVDGGEIFPRDSFYKMGDGSNVLDPRKGLWHPVVSLWLYQADVDPAYLWRLLPAFLVFFAFAAFVYFAFELLGGGWCVALAVLFLILFFRGEGVEWLTKIGFSRNIAQVILWIDVALLLRYYRLNGSWRLILAALLALVGTAFHIIFIFLLAVILAGVCIYVLLSRSGRQWRPRYVMSILTLLPAVAIPLVVRVSFTFADFNYIHTHRQGMLLLSETLAVVDPVEVLSRIGLVFFFALILSPFIFRFGPRGYHRNLVGALFVLPVLLVFCPWIAVVMERQMGYLYYRLLYAAPTMCLLTLGIIGLFRIIVSGGTRGSGDRPKSRNASARRRALSDGNKEHGGSSFEHRAKSRGSFADRATFFALGVLKRLVAAGIVALFIYYPVRFALNGFVRSVEKIMLERSEPDERYAALLKMLERELPEHSIIVSDPQTSYVISALTDHFVVVTLDQHCSPADAVALERLRAVRDIFSPVVPMARCRKWFPAFGVEYLLLNTNTIGVSDFYETMVPGHASLAYEKFISCPDALRERFSDNGFCLFEVMNEPVKEEQESRCLEAVVSVLPCERPGAVTDEPLSVPKELDTGFGIALDTLNIRGVSFLPGDTVSGSFCWKAISRIAYELPIEWVIRLDTEYPRGAFFRSWYSKQYRRGMERRNSALYRLTIMERLRSGYSDPDQWSAGDRVRQDFSFVLPKQMASGTYTMRIKAYRRSYIPNRRIADYLRNEDTLHGELIGTVHIGEQ